MAPSGSLSWEVYEGKLPDNAVVSHLSDEATTTKYVCRGWTDDTKTRLVTGYYTTYSNHCYVVFRTYY